MRKHVSNIKKDGYDYILLNSISKTKGKTYRYSSRPHKYQTKTKVIFSNGRYIVPFYDNGELGITEGGLYIFVDSKKEGAELIKYLNTKLIKFIIKATKWSNFETSKQIFRYIPKITDFEITNTNVYNFFGLTDNEIKQINMII